MTDKVGLVAAIAVAVAAIAFLLELKSAFSVEFGFRMGLFMLAVIVFMAAVVYSDFSR